MRRVRAFGPFPSAVCGGDEDSVMCEIRNTIELHCKEGAPYVVFQPSGIPQSVSEIAEGMTVNVAARIGEAARILVAFYENCQEQFALFYLANDGFRQLLDRHGHLLKASEDNTMFFGSGHPNTVRSTAVARLPIGRLLNNLEKDGEFVSRLAKMTLVYIYHQWDENFREKIANSLSIAKCRVECALMGDIRLIRNAIVHNDSVVEQNLIKRLKILAGIWIIRAGTLDISSDMIEALVEQINGIRIRINSH